MTRPHEIGKGEMFNTDVGLVTRWAEISWHRDERHRVTKKQHLQEKRKRTEKVDLLTLK